MVLINCHQHIAVPISAPRLFVFDDLINGAFSPPFLSNVRTDPSLCVLQTNLNQVYDNACLFKLHIHSILLIFLVCFFI